MASRSARPRLLASIVAAIALVAACHILAPVFVGAPAVSAARTQTALSATKDDTRRGALLGFLGSAAAAANMKSAEAAGGYGEPPKISIFGLSINTDGPTSDGYNFVDKDAESPYSEFSGGDKKERIFQAYQDDTNTKLAAELQECWRRYETDVKRELDRRIPNRVRMEATRQVGLMRKDMLYFSDLPPRDLTRTKLAKDFFSDIEGMLVFVDRSRWSEADDYYAKSLVSLQKWKQASNF